MRIEITYKQSGTLLERTLIREFPFDLSEVEIRNVGISEILSDLGVDSYTISYEK